MKTARNLWAMPLFLLSTHTALFATDALPESQNSCRIIVDYDVEYEEAVASALSNLERYEDLCAFLEARNLHVVLKGTSGILEERSYAWVLVTLASSETGVDAGGHQTVTLLGSPADSVEERRVLFAVMERALEIVANSPSRFVSSESTR